MIEPSWVTTRLNASPRFRFGVFSVTFYKLPTPTVAFAPLRKTNFAGGDACDCHHSGRMSHLASNWHHDLPGEWRTARARPADGRTRISAHHEALRPDKRMRLS